MNTNIASLAAQRRLGETGATLATANERLASGLRVNRASDDAAGLAIASSLRSNVRVFNQGVRNLNDGISYLQIAASAVTEMKGILQRVGELAEQSANGVYSTTQRRALDAEANAIQSEYNRIMETAQFNGITVLSSSNTTVDFQSGYGLNGMLRVNIGVGAGSQAVATGDGTFQARVSVALGAGIPGDNVAAGDFNNDGKMDIIAGENTLKVLLGQGNGTFGAPITVVTQQNNGTIGVFDFNGDGKLDLATTGGNLSYVEIHLGNGDGTFQPSSRITTWAGAGNVRLSDLNGDGKQDLIADGNGIANVFLGNGNGTFAAAKSYDLVGGDVRSITLADVTGDGLTDIVGVCFFSVEKIVVLAGNGNGTFGAAKSSFAGGGLDITAGDLNGDGRTDIVTADYGADDLLVYLGDNSGFFNSADAFSDGLDPNGVRLADLNGDGKLDAVTINDNGARMNVFLGNGDGTFKARQSYATGSHPWGLVLTDLNGDGALDMVESEHGTNRIGVFMANTTSSSVASGVLPLSRMGSLSITTQSIARQALDLVGAFGSELDTVASSIGAWMSRMETAIRATMVASENSSAAQGRIMDADIAVEASNQIRSGILQQVGASIASQSALQSQIALQLLRV